MAKIISINTSKEKGVAKKPVEKAVLKKDHGIVGDAHAGPGNRQISLLAKEDIDEFAKNKLCLKHGDFAENITTQGIELPVLKLGTRLKLGTAIVEVSKIGKECHADCEIMKKVGKCIMPTRGIFVIVIEEGEICQGDEIEVLD